MTRWYPNSWKQKQALYLPVYKDIKLLDEVLNDLNHSSPLVSNHSIQQLKQALTDPDCFILQVGDCAESFEQEKNYTENQINFIHELKILCEHLLPHRHIISIGRIAGQFAKPRTQAYEADQSTLTYRGDIIHDFALNDRIPNAYRMKLAYDHAVNSKKIIDQLNKKNNTCFYISHEALLLPYETAFTHFDSFSNGYFNTSAHFLWLGERTKAKEGAHVEYLRGIENPIGIKISAQTKPEDLLTLIKILNPNNTKGKITLIVRMGAQAISQALPHILTQIKLSKQQVRWISDPMHGNTKQKKQYKIRYIDSITKELSLFFRILQAHDIQASGIHLEATYDDVLECLLPSDHLISNRYKTKCDPRLNKMQSLQLIQDVFSQITKMDQTRRTGSKTSFKR